MARAAGHGMRFTQLTLERWRNFSKVEMDLSSRVFLVGPNASGKSNLLDVFRFLKDIVSVGGGFAEAVRNRGGVKSIRSLSARRPPEIRIAVSIGTDDTPHAWQYELQFSQDAQRHLPIVKKEWIARDGEVLLSRPNKEDRDDPARLQQTHLEQISANKDFRDIPDFFSSIKYLHIVPQLVREPDRSIGRRFDPFGGDFIEQMSNINKKTRESRLGKISKALKVAVPQLRELTLNQDKKGSWHLSGKYDHWRPQGAWQTEERFSDGTLRLLGLLWSLLETGGPLLLEEPELSLHADVVRHIPQMFARMQLKSARQVMLSTHSEALLSDSGIGPDEVHLLIPGAEGTNVVPAVSQNDIRHLLDGGFTIGEAVLPRTRPQRSDQLALFEA